VYARWLARDNYWPWAPATKRLGLQADKPFFYAHSQVVSGKPLSLLGNPKKLAKWQKKLSL
jgi:hypothetical protein